MSNSEIYEWWRTTTSRYIDRDKVIIAKLETRLAEEKAKDETHRDWRYCQNLEQSIAELKSALLREEYYYNYYKNKKNNIKGAL